MGSFQYDAIKISDRSKVSGWINAGSEKEARELLRDQDLLPTKLKVIASNDTLELNSKNPIASMLQKFGGVSSKDKIAFSRNMGMMIKAGIPVTEALMYFENYATNLRFKKVISSVRKDILSGISLSKALSKHKDMFDDVYVTVTQAGEASGELEQTMARLTDLQVKAEALKMKVISASVYPIIVLCIMSIVMLIMFVLVLPTFAQIYEQMNVDLPWITRFMLGISSAFRDFWWITFPAIGASIYGIVQYIKSPSGKRMIDLYVLKVPVAGELVKFIQNSHFISTFAVSFNAGLPITDALQLSAFTVRHTQIRAAFLNVNVEIQAGQRLAHSLAKTGYVPDLVLLMLSTGEESGELDRMLETSFEYLEEEINHRVDILTSMMEPLMLLVLGVMVCALALAIYLPLFSVYENI